MCGESFIETDAPECYIGGVLQQNQGQELQYIACYSKKLTGIP